MQKNPRKIRWVGGSGVHPVYAYYFHPQHGEGYNPLWYDPQLGGPPLFISGIMLRFFVKMCPGATFGARISKGFHAGDIELRSAAKLV